MAQILTLTNDARQTFTTILNNQKVQLTAFYIDANAESEIESGWYANLALIGTSTTPIVQGVRLTAYVGLLQNLVIDFDGDIIPMPLTSPPLDLTNRNPWESTYTLVYFTSGELAS